MEPLRPDGTQKVIRSVEARTNTYHQPAQEVLKNQVQMSAPKSAATKLGESSLTSEHNSRPDQAAQPAPVTTLTKRATTQSKGSELAISNDDWDMWSQVLRNAVLKVPGSKSMTKETLEEEMNASITVDLYGQHSVGLTDDSRNVVKFAKDYVHKKLIITFCRIKIESKNPKKAGVYIATRTSIEHYEQSSSQRRSLWIELNFHSGTWVLIVKDPAGLISCVPEKGPLSPFDFALKVKKRNVEIEELRERFIRGQLDLDTKKAALSAAQSRIRGLERASRTQPQAVDDLSLQRVNPAEARGKEYASREEPTVKTSLEACAHAALVREVVAAMKKVWEDSAPERDIKSAAQGNASKKRKCCLGTCHDESQRDNDDLMVPYKKRRYSS